jgi:hypothetical protein
MSVMPTMTTVHSSSFDADRAGSFISLASAAMPSKPTKNPSAMNVSRARSDHDSAARTAA